MVMTLAGGTQHITKAAFQVINPGVFPDEIKHSFLTFCKKGAVAILKFFSRATAPFVYGGI